jgi:hypothetical protein
MQLPGMSHRQRQYSLTCEGGCNHYGPVPVNLQAGDRAVATLRRASLFFLAGLLSVGVALAIFIVEVTF